jgi:hypothetical protein
MNINTEISIAETQALLNKIKELLPSEILNLDLYWIESSLKKIWKGHYDERYLTEEVIIKYIKAIISVKLAKLYNSTNYKILSEKEKFYEDAWNIKVKSLHKDISPNRLKINPQLTKKNPETIRKQLLKLEGMLVKVYPGLTTIPYIGILRKKDILMPPSSFLKLNKLTTYTTLHLYFLTDEKGKTHITLRPENIKFIKNNNIFLKSTETITL